MEEDQLLKAVVRLEDLNDTLEALRARGKRGKRQLAASTAAIASASTSVPATTGCAGYFRRRVENSSLRRFFLARTSRWRTLTLPSRR